MNVFNKDWATSKNYLTKHIVYNFNLIHWETNKTYYGCV